MPLHCGADVNGMPVSAVGRKIADAAWLGV